MKNKKIVLRAGIDDFKDLISSNGLTVDSSYIFVDKTIFIKKFLEHGSGVLLITRPRRWGKSLALSMLRYFLEKEVGGKSTAGLFHGLKISEYITLGSVLEKYQGNYPVVMVGFKNVKTGPLEEIKAKVAANMSNLFLDYKYLLNNSSIKEEHGQDFEDILFERATDTKQQASLFLLSEMLFKYHGKKVFILIDEYDNPINDNYDNPDTLRWLTGFLGTMFGIALKSNPYLEKGLVTGVLRITKAEIFSGLNNIIEESILDNLFAKDYGFTEEEAFDLIKKTNLENVNFDDVRLWYNGYTVGDFKMYNPWSITQFITKQGNLEAYWVNTSSPRMLQQVFIDNAKSTDKAKVGLLLRKEELELGFDLKKSISMDDIFYNSESVWSLMLHSGYLTLFEKNNLRKVKFPNYEVRQLIEEFVHVWFVKNSIFSDAANALLFGNMDYFLEAMSRVLQDPSYSARIFNNKAANNQGKIDLKEFMYQFLVMTQLRCINSGSKDFEVIAEPELVSFGKTRPDFIALNHPAKLCVVGEIKTLLRNETLEVGARRALDQIKKNNYGSKYEEEGYKLLKLGISFACTDIEMIWEE